ncbi:MAG: 50S ribosomal protein L2 [Candidatus Auribacterota bacterium]
MALKKFKPTSPARRFASGPAFDEITKNAPEKSLCEKLVSSGGRNSTGRITVRRRGGGHKKTYRIIDFKRDKFGVSGKVVAIEYDPNRTSRIALVQYVDGEKRYILAPVGLNVGDVVMSGEKAEIEVGNALPLSIIPLGMQVHNIELKEKKGGQIARSAGSAATIMAREGGFAFLKFPSGEVRKVSVACYATIGQIGNMDHMNIRVGKAGRNRWKGNRPKVRGVAMNPVDHPMGGGEGRTSGGRHPCSPWGWITKGKKTRDKHKSSDKYIVKRRNK